MAALSLLGVVDMVGMGRGWGWFGMDGVCMATEVVEVGGYGAADSAANIVVVYAYIVPVIHFSRWIKLLLVGI